MNAAENNLVQSLTGKPSLQETTVDEWRAITLQYPYFSLAQLLLTKKIRQQQPGQFDAQLQHCAVFFQNIKWLQGQLYCKEDKLMIADETDKLAITVKANSIDIADIAIVRKNKSEEELLENANLITLPAEDVLNDFALQMNDVKDEPELPPLDEEELENIDENAANAAAKIADVLQQQVEAFKAPVQEETDVPISTEPYHTIDYFASQGIKVDTQVLDAFTKKVHTFTDWLKQMKRISNYPTDLGSDPDMENYVQSIADNSNQPEAVDTEAMAEVLVKQGKLDKAIEVYEKLSLLNPAKTAYFAAKINQLKAL
ncbi:hypothetical protein FC093_09420 [Ilyomonas limi]|uniref:Tetratricopeptide repeat protein n=1 Tax=Ilyomonas limi TaxID=2575867 RepID=A0A4U3L1N4_9BACT|nr:hypothetical protein [Ilyomonas limi]TKK68905.1 hypothetical protein FC093_09420 [Ilyomonas limi]